MTQFFKGDALELKMYEAGMPAMESVSLSLDQFFENCYDADDFLLMLYDTGRVPFTDRIQREAFVAFYRGFLANAPRTGTFASYVFLLQALFGENSEMQFDVPAPGQLEILIDAESSVPFGFQVEQIVDGEKVTYDLVTHDDEEIEFTGITGIESEAQIEALLAEIIPAGISPTIIFQVFDLFDFVGEDDSGEFTITDHNGDTIVFIETGA